MKCENESCNNEVRDEEVESDIDRGCAAYCDHDDCTRHCSCCLDCRQRCIDEMQAEENED